MTSFRRIAPMLVASTLLACAHDSRNAEVASPPRPVGGGPRQNPFAVARLFANPAYAAEVRSTAALVPSRADSFRRVADIPTAIWIDSIARAHDVGHFLDEAREAERGSGEPGVTVFVLYDLPGRDCAAVASSGELGLGQGEERYRRDFVDLVAEQVRAHREQRVAFVVEPDSLANLATNLSLPRCAAAERAYRTSIAYAIRTLSLPNVSLYLDAAHAGWLGWDANRAKIARVMKEVLDAAGGPELIRGFATNVSNYNTLEAADGKRLAPANPCPDEMTYIDKLRASLAEVGIVDKGFVIDTGRDGRSVRSDWGIWCNVEGAGLGERPRAAPAPGIDAYLWIKPPGESDGGSDPGAPGYDRACAAAGSMPGAPAAGRWFGAYFLNLVDNANPPL